MPPDAARQGLPERKKARTHTAIRTHAFHLFRSRGYEATMVAQIISGTDVSSSTFFRYFPTKEDVVLADSQIPLLVAALHAQPLPLPPVAAVRAA